MAGSVPWSVNAVDPEAWADARDAARRSGQSVGEWLEGAIRDAAHDRKPPRASARPDIDPIERRLDDIAARLEHFSRLTRETAPVRPVRSDAAVLSSVEALNQRLDALSREMRAGERNGPAEVRAAIQKLEDRIEHLLARSRVAEAGASPELGRKLDEISRSIEVIGRQLAQENAQYEAQGFDAASVPSTVEELDNAVAEIMMRQSVLDGTPPPRTARPARSNSGARRERAPAAAAAPVDFSGLERQLKIMTDEMQALRQSGVQNEAIAALRKEIGDLSAKLGDLAPRRSLESIECAIDNIALRIDRGGGARDDQTLNEVVDSLHDIRAALADVRPAESFTAVERDLRALSSKLDSIGTRGLDNSAVARLQEQTAEIRDLLSAALPSDVLRALVEQIETLVTKFEERRTEPDNALVDVMNAFDRRIEALSERIEAAARQAPAVPALDEIRQRLDTLQDAIARRDHGPQDGIDSALRALAQKVDATEARLDNLGSIERGLSDIVVQLEEARANAREAAETAAREAAERAARATVRQMAAVQASPAAPEPAPARTAAAELETKYSSAQRRNEAPAVEPPTANPRAVTQLRVTAMEKEQEEEPDVPLEPGSGVPRVRMQSAALRIAQSEAALGELGAAPAEPAGKTSDFIAAARRAAQAAAAEPLPDERPSPTTSIRGRLSALIGNNGRRALLLALAAFLLIVTAVRFLDGGMPLRFGSAPVEPAKVAPKAELPPASAPEAMKAETPAQLGDTGAALAPADSLVAAPPAGVLGGAVDLHFQGLPVTPPETTGSTNTRTSAAPVVTAAAPAAVKPENAGAVPSNAADAIPAALGTPALRSAASAGDPAAAYEIGTRYLDGRGVRADVAEAVTWFERAFAKGSLPAAYRLGSIHEKGMNGRKNIAEAIRYYSAAAEGGNVKAMHNLAVIHAEGGEGQPNMREAVRWFRMAAERGVRDSQYNLGVLYARGLGVEQNFAESYRWFAIAAGQGDEDAAGKREDVAKRLDVQTLVATKLAVQTWTPANVIPAANEVPLRPEWKSAEGPARPRSAKK